MLSLLVDCACMYVRMMCNFMVVAVLQTGLNLSALFFVQVLHLPNPKTALIGKLSGCRGDAESYTVDVSKG